MKLETAQTLASDDVTEEELIQAFRDDAGRGEFIILGQSDQVYIQASGEADKAFVMEYREGDDAHHFQCSRDLSKSDVQSAFLKYLRGDESWKRDFEWTQPESKPWWKVW
jgi:hypothetical protein